MLKKTLLTLSLALPLATFAQKMGKLDTAFYSNGSSTLNLARNARGVSMVRSFTDSSFVVAGVSFDTLAFPQNYNLFVAKYNGNGKLDSTFGTQGKVVFTDANLRDDFVTIRVRNGKIIIASTITKDTITSIGLIQLKANGAVDSSFGTAGRTKVDPPAGYNYLVRSMDVNTDAGIVVTGAKSLNPYSNSIMLAAFDSTGVLRSDFGDSGIVSTTIPTTFSNCIGWKINLLGGIFVGATANFTGIPNWVLLNYKNNGALNLSFGGQSLGYTVVDTTGTNASVKSLNAMIRDYEGSFYLGGKTFSNKSSGVVVKVRSNGVVDAAFGNNGYLEITDSISSVSITGLTAEQGSVFTEGLYVVGNYTHDSVSRSFVRRYNEDGSLISPFGNNGVASDTFGSKNHSALFAATPVVLSQTENIVFAGEVSKQKIGTTDFNDLLIVAYRTKDSKEVPVGIIDFKKNANNLIVFPNPVANEFTLKYSLKEAAEISISIYDIQGKLVGSGIQHKLQAVGEHIEKMNIASLPSGNYIISISDNNHAVSTKIVK